MHILISVLPEFTDKSTKAKYLFKGEEIEGTFAPGALYPKLNPDHILALCTKEARKPYKDFNKSAVDVLKEEVGEGKVSVAAIEVDWSLDQFLDSASKSLDSLVNGSKEAKISVDFTHGPRQYAIMVYALAAYYCELHALEFAGAYSCQYVKDAAGQVHDLSDFSRLQQWLGAVKQFKNGGSLAGIHHLLQEQSNDKDLLNALQGVESALRFGLPLEAGNASRKFLNSYRKVLGRELKNLPQSTVLKDQILSELESLRLEVVNEKGWKTGLVLTEVELARQVQLVNGYLRTNNYSVAMALMSEWIVSVVTKEFEADWLNFDARQRSSRRLRKLLIFFRDYRDRLPEKAATLANFWDKLSDVRNSYAHCGMRPQDVNDKNNFGSKVTAVTTLWKQFQCPTTLVAAVKDAESGLSFGYENLLITPVSYQLGLAYQFIKKMEVQPSHIIFLSSKEMDEGIGKLMQKLGIAESGATRFMLEDVYGGDDLVKSYGSIENKLKPSLVDSRNLHVNLTGGSSFMSYCADSLANFANSISTVKKYMVIDRRTRDEQLENPWFEGAVVKAMSSITN